MFLWEVLSDILSLVEMFEWSIDFILFFDSLGDKKEEALIYWDNFDGLFPLRQLRFYVFRSNFAESLFEIEDFVEGFYLWTDSKISINLIKLKLSSK